MIMRPQWGLLESGRAELVWRDARSRFAAQVIGPHFERLCRAYALTAPPERFGALPGEVGAGVVTDPQRRRRIEVDVAVFAPAVPGERRRLLSLGEVKWGEVKWGEVKWARHVDRLRRARDLLAGRGYDTRDTVLTCYSGVGFEPGLIDDGEPVRTVGLADLYPSPSATQ
ncbi:hypothetical protein [Micromonospora sp. Llam0]|uniref:hypothetical protein n=1 Tax=Micromonospora sp. Llam0 TaxID=2485143 RepID=UPI0018F67CD8|nr:hypothetical protein [Micromonospora sp. Llam0]